SIVRAGNPAKQVAIARRPQVAEAVADALVATCDRTVVKATLWNHGACLAESAMSRVVDQFAHDTAVQELLSGRPHLPLAVAPRWGAWASDDLAAGPWRGHSLPAEGFDELMMHGRDRAVSSRIAAHRPEDAGTLAASLARRNMLPAMLLRRCLCAGSLVFFEA